MPEKLALLWLAAFPLMGSPGPATMSLAALGAAFGVRRSAAYLIGICTGTICVLLMIAAGITAVILTIPQLKTAITIAAAAYILYLAWRIATAPVLKEGANSGATAPSFPSGFFLAVANPKAFAAIGAVYSGNILLDNSIALDAAAKIVALAAVIVAVNSAWLYFGSLISGVLRNPRAGRIANVVFALLLLVSVALALM